MTDDHRPTTYLLNYSFLAKETQKHKEAFDDQSSPDLSRPRHVLSNDHVIMTASNTFSEEKCTKPSNTAADPLNINATHIDATNKDEDGNSRTNPDSSSWMYQMYGQMFFKDDGTGGDGDPGNDDNGYDDDDPVNSPGGLRYVTNRKKRIRNQVSGSNSAVAWNTSMFNRNVYLAKFFGVLLCFAIFTALMITARGSDMVPHELADFAILAAMIATFCCGGYYMSYYRSVINVENQARPNVDVGAAYADNTAQTELDKKRGNLLAATPVCIGAECCGGEGGGGGSSGSASAMLPDELVFRNGKCEPKFASSSTSSSSS